MNVYADTYLFNISFSFLQDSC